MDVKKNAKEERRSLSSLITISDWNPLISNANSNNTDFTNPVCRISRATHIDHEAVFVGSATRNPHLAHAYRSENECYPARVHVYVYVIHIIVWARCMKKLLTANIDNNLFNEP